MVVPREKVVVSPEGPDPGAWGGQLGDLACGYELGL